MISYQPFQSVRLGQVAYAQSYPPSGLEWGQGWGRFAPSSAKVVLPKSPQAGGGVGYTSEGTVLSQQQVEELTASTGGPGGAAAGAAAGAGAGGGGGASGQGPSSSSGIGFPLAAAAVATLAIVGSMVV